MSSEIAVPSISLVKPAEQIWSTVFVGRVFPLQRPRFTNGHVYQPLDDQLPLRGYLQAQAGAKPILGSLWLECMFIFEGLVGADCDNLLKAVGDALQDAKIIKNDRQIRGGTYVAGTTSNQSFTLITLRNVTHVTQEIPTGSY